MSVFLRRFLEYFVLEAVLSAIFAMLFNFGIIPSYMIVVNIVTVLMLIAYITAHVFMLRMCCFGVADMNKYFLYNLSAYLCFAVISIICLLLLPSDIFTWFFGLTKLFRYMGYKISAGLSLILFHFIMVILIPLAPIRMPLMAPIGEDIPENSIS